MLKSKTALRDASDEDVEEEEEEEEDYEIIEVPEIQSKTPAAKSRRGTIRVSVFRSLVSVEPVCSPCFRSILECFINSPLDRLRLDFQSTTRLQVACFACYHPVRF